MSGGVDSSVAAHLLLGHGYEVIGVFLRHGLAMAEPVHQGCCSAADAHDARRVADQLGIPFYSLNFEDEFDQIVDYFVDEYVHGRTPNPCVVCNHWVKFGRLMDYADSVGAEYIATGHYARLVSTDGDCALRRGRDPSKDQSYVLFGIERRLLARILLPVGDFHKSEIRKLAAEIGLAVAGKQDSQEICFVPGGSHADFVRQRKGVPNAPGDIVTVDGKVVGQHDGIEQFTIGQRKGLGVAMGEPYFVVRIDPDTNRVVIGRRDSLERKQLRASRCNWLVNPPVKPFPCHAQIRYNSEAVPAVGTLIRDDRLSLVFDEPVYGVAPGQAVVCYDGDRVMGGGWID